VPKQKKISKYPEAAPEQINPLDGVVLEAASPAPLHLAYENAEAGIWLYNDNCLTVMDAIAAKYPEGRFDMIFADPPYFLSNGGISKSVSIADLKPFDKINLGEETAPTNLFSWCAKSVLYCSDTGEQIPPKGLCLPNPSDTLNRQFGNKPIADFFLLQKSGYISNRRYCPCALRRYNKRLPSLFLPLCDLELFA
jgi:hypothetical protein